MLLLWLQMDACERAMILRKREILLTFYFGSALTILSTWRLSMKKVTGLLGESETDDMTVVVAKIWEHI